MSELKNIIEYISGENNKEIWETILAMNKICDNKIRVDSMTRQKFDNNIYYITFIFTKKNKKFFNVYMRIVNDNIKYINVDNNHFGISENIEKQIDIDNVFNKMIKMYLEVNR